MRTFILTLLLALTAFPSLSHAEVSIYEQNGWKVNLGGFVEMDTFYDTTRSFAEVVGNGAVARKGTFNGDNGRTQFSMRNSRLSFNVFAPVVDDWKIRGYLEFDFLGYDPSPSSSNSPGVSESAFFTNPTLRMRHGYISAESNNLQIIAGQGWSLFGWQPLYVLSSISVNPISGSSYQRTPKLAAIKTIEMSDSNVLQAGLSIERPSQRDGKLPNVVAALRFTDNDRKGGFTGPNSDIKAFGMGIGVSGTYRNYDQTASPTTSTTSTVSIPAFAVAVNALLPIIASSDGKDVSHTLTATGEFTAGRGYGDEFSSWAGGLVQTYTGAATQNTNNTNIDAGLGGYDGSGNFDLIKLRTFNYQLQYHVDGKSFFTAGYGQLYSSNIANYLNATGVTNGNLYDRVESKFVNFGRDFTPQLRLALEFDQFTTHYVSDGKTNFDNRYMMATYFRF